VQPVRIVVPTGATISFWNGETFEVAGESAATFDLTLRSVYRLRISGIPEAPGAEIYPSVEILDRLHPPEERIKDAVVIVEIPTGDLNQALAGKLVTRVVYLEYPDTAMPYRQSAEEQPYFDVRPEDNPLSIARQLGRPFAVVRLGSRIPEPGDISLAAGISSAPSDGGPFRFQGVGGLEAGADEYLYDGGDRNAQATVDQDWSMSGMEPEDTIAHFDALDGRRVVEASNRVRIYAPRFAAVRRLSGAIAANSYGAALSAKSDVPSFEGSQSDRTSTTLQNFQPLRHTSALVASSLRDQTRGLTVDNVWTVKSFQGRFLPHEDFQIIRNGVLENSEKARLGIRIASALAWDSDLNVQVAEGRVKPLVVRDAMSVAETIVDGRSSRPRIRVIKVASTNYARPGDEVDFTIRFDNVGDEEIGNVTIVDSLTTRLEFVPDSAECSVAGEFKTEPNAAHSLSLRWEITDPLDPGAGGIIRFKCKVR
jgi:uncharacterized repeat protein (TIGR01451 family)